MAPRTENVRVGKIIVDKLGITKGECVLEVGCSIGTQARQLAMLGYHVVGVDSDAGLIRQFNELARREQLFPDRTYGLIGDGERLPFKDGCFRAVICTEVLEHTTNPLMVVDEIARVLDKDGTLCISVPTERIEELFVKLHPRWREYSGHIQTFRRSRLLELVQRAGFSVGEERGECFEWTLFWLVFAALRTPFDFTGTPTANKMLARIYWKLWRILNAAKVWQPLQAAGDRWLPKSWYLYARRL